MNELDHGLCDDGGVGHVSVRLQAALIFECGVGALRAPVLARRLVDRPDVARQGVGLPERNRAERALMVAPLLVDHAPMPRQVARVSERLWAVGALVLAQFLVYAAHVPSLVACVQEDARAVGAWVLALRFERVPVGRLRVSRKVVHVVEGCRAE